MSLLLYDVYNNLAPDHIKNMSTNLSSVHSYPTRSVTNENSCVEQLRTENMKQAFSVSGALIWNSIPLSIKMNASREEKRACPFSSSTPRRKKMTKSFCRQRVGFEIIAESEKGSYYNQEKWLKDDKAPEKPIETTAESSFTSSLASRASYLGREAAKRETKSREVPCHIKIGRSTGLKVYNCSGKQASRKTPRSGLLSIFPGKWRTFKNCIE